MIKKSIVLKISFSINLLVCGLLQAGQNEMNGSYGHMMPGLAPYSSPYAPNNRVDGPNFIQTQAYPGAANMRNSAQMPSNGQGDIYTVRAFPLQGSIKLGGTVIPLKAVTFTAQISGRVEYVAGSEGDYMEQGQILVAIDDDDLLAQRRSALAELSNADGAIRNAQVQYSREFISPQSKNINRSPGMGMPSMFDQFFTRNFGSAMGYGNPELDRHADLYSQGTAVNQAVARQLRARAKLDEVDARLRDTRAIAPFSGVIIKKRVEVGDTVQPGQAVLELANTRNLQLMVDVPARLMPGLQPGMVVNARLDVGDVEVQARVAQIYPVADIERHTVTVKFNLPENIPGGPGMYAEVMIPNVSATPRYVTAIPVSAVRPRGSLNVVYRVSDNNDIAIRYVRLGEQLDKDRVVVLSGLVDNDRILIYPDDKIRELREQNRATK